MIKSFFFSFAFYVPPLFLCLHLFSLFTAALPFYVSYVPLVSWKRVKWQINQIKGNEVKKLEYSSSTLKFIKFRRNLCVYNCVRNWITQNFLFISFQLQTSDFCLMYFPTWWLLNKEYIFSYPPLYHVAKTMQCAIPQVKFYFKELSFLLSLPFSGCAFYTEDCRRFWQPLSKFFPVLISFKRESVYTFPPSGEEQNIS